MRYLLTLCLIWASIFAFNQESAKLGETEFRVINTDAPEIGEVEFIQFKKGEIKKFSDKKYFGLDLSTSERQKLKHMVEDVLVFNKEDTIKLKFQDGQNGVLIFENPKESKTIIANIQFRNLKDDVIKMKSMEGTMKFHVLSKQPKEPIFKDDKIVFGILMAILALVFWTNGLENPMMKKFYKFIPALFLCYFLPAILATFGVISAEHSGLWGVAKNYFLPAALFLMTISIDIKGLIGLGPKALIMFLTATVGIILGGVFSVWLFSMVAPDAVGGEGNAETWRGLATLAGSWIGGGANQTAMLEVYKYKQELYGAMVTVDIVVANIWMAVLILGIGKRKQIDKWLKADNKAIDTLVERMENFQKQVSKPAGLRDYMMIAGIGFFFVGLSHLLSSLISDSLITMYSDMGMNPEEKVFASKFFWLVVFATFFGFMLSLTKARNLEGAGASKIGSVFIYMLVVVIGMKMDITKILDQPMLFLVGLVWMAFHVLLLVLVAKLIRAPYFFLAVGSKANVGGAASAPVVAGAFHPALTTVGVLLAVFGYFLGTYGAIICAELMRLVS
ncbi:MAG: DUF819 family protein [Crocinitomicaceae bacterium]